MSYLDQRTSPARIWALGIVAILHVLIGIAFVTGFYQRFTKEGVKDLDVFDVEEPPPPEEEPPPPEEVPEPVSPEVVAPPPIVRAPTPPPPITTTSVIPPPAPPTFVATPPRPNPPTPPAVPPTPPPEPPATPPTAVRLRSGSISNADYPSSAIRSGASGTTRITLTVNADGSVGGCTVSGSSGNSALDSTACSLARRRFRFTPATRNGQNVASTYSQSVRWVLPDE